MVNAALLTQLVDLMAAPSVLIKLPTVDLEVEEEVVVTTIPMEAAEADIREVEATAVEADMARIPSRL